MKTGWMMIAAAFGLAACQPNAQHSAQQQGQANDACDLIGTPSSLFGENADVQGYRGMEGMAASCEWLSSDGRRSGDLVLYTRQSLGNESPEARLTSVLTDWSAEASAPLAPVADLGAGAQIATELPGAQVQIAFRKNDALVLIAARSSDPTITDEALARAIARAANFSLESRP